MSLLSKPEILRHRAAGNIIIDPFDTENLNTASYDVTLGSWYFCPQRNVGGRRLFNPYSESDVKRVWGEPCQAQPLRQWLDEQHDLAAISALSGINSNTPVILIAPQETLLCHTNEFVGGKRCITTEMKARSSTGRIFLSVCKCAGWGDVGYFNRWTMEVENASSEYWLVLPVGYRFAQIAFFEVEPVGEETYSTLGKYQTGSDLAKLKAIWRPKMMLPRLDRDRESIRANARDCPTADSQKSGRYGFTPDVPDL